MAGEMKSYRKGGKMKKSGMMKGAYSGQGYPGGKMSSGKKRHSLRGGKPSSSGTSSPLGMYADQLSGGLYGKTGGGY